MDTIYNENCIPFYWDKMHDFGFGGSVWDNQRKLLFKSIIIQISICKSIDQVLKYSVLHHFVLKELV